jgi:hypothetical protein
MRKKNVATNEKNLQKVHEGSNELTSKPVNYSMPTSFHHTLPDFYRFKQRLRNRSQELLERLTSLLYALLFVPEQKSAEIKIHVKQDADRRIPPGRNPGSGGTR